MAKALVASMAVLLAVAGCGSVKAPGSSSPLPQPSPPTAALAKWKDFPASANPRPLVVFETSIEHIGQSGFVSEPDRKVAWGCNRFVFAAGVRPSAEVPVAATAAGVSYPAISSSRAYAELTAARKQVEVPVGCAELRPFVIKAIRYGSAGFFTDRGTTTMSAWLFDIAEVDAYLGYAAIDPASFFSGGITAQGRGAGASADGRTLKIGVSNAQPGPCGADYTVAAAESSTAVAVAVKRIPHTPPDSPVACDAMLRWSFIDVTLTSPLGGRVLVDEEGHAGSACIGKNACEITE